MTTLIIIALAPVALLWAWALGVALEGIGKEIALLVKEITS